MLQMLQLLQNFANCQKFQFDNLVDFEKCCKTRIQGYTDLGVKSLQG